MTDETSLDVVLTHLETALDRESAVRSSIEQRIGSLTGVYTAVVAAGIALAALVETDTPISTGAPRIMLVIGGGLAVAGLVACVAGLTPQLVGEPTDGDYLALPRLARADDDANIGTYEGKYDLAEALAEDLVVMRHGSGFKANCLAIGAAGFVASLTLFTLSLVVAL